MKKIIMCLLIIFCIFNFSQAHAKNINVKISNKDFKTSPVNVKVDGENKYSKEMPSFIYNRRTLVPIRFLSETFGAKVDWDQKSRAVTIKMPEKNIVLYIDKSKANIDGVNKNIDKSYIARLAKINGGGTRTYVPLRFISELFGYEVSWDKQTMTAIINTNMSNNPEETANSSNETIVLPSDTDDMPEIKPDTPQIKANENTGESPIITANSDNINHLKGISLTSYNGKDALLFQGLKGNYKAMMLSDPTRLVFDFENAIFDDVDLYREYNIYINGIKGVRASQFADNETSISDKNVRIVIDLEDSAIDYQIDETDAGLVFYLKGSMKNFYTYSDRTFMIKNTEAKINDYVYDDFKKTITIDVNTNKELETGTEKFRDPLIRNLSIDKTETGYRYTINLVRNVLIDKVDISGADFAIKLSRIVNGKPSDYLIMLDPGHGGRDPGAVSDIDGSSEIDYIPYVARALEAKLKAAGYNVLKTNDTYDEYVDIFERAKMANRVNADIFVSIHVNKATSSIASGFEVLYSSEAKHKNKTRNQTELANCILNAVGELIGNKGRGLKEGAYVVTRNTNMPAALLEMEFLSNKKGLALLKSQAYLDKMVDGLYNGIVDYLNNYY